jgi:hypothetical protein
MSLWLVPLDYSLPNLQAYLGARGGEPLDPAEIEVAAEMLARCVKTSEVLIEFALRVAGRPCLQ